VPASHNFGTCTKAASANVAVQTPPGFQVQKSTLTPVIDAGGRFRYNVDYVSFGTAVVAPDVPSTLLQRFVNEADGTSYTDLEADVFPFTSTLAWFTYGIDTVPGAVDQYAPGIPFGSPVTQEHRVDAGGRVIGAVDELTGANTDDWELGGFSIVADALHGWIRDDAWVMTAFGL